MIIAISNHKGGVGKTTSTINIGAGLSNGKMGAKVLIIDLDPQANLTQSLGINDPKFTIYNALRHECELKMIQITKNLDLIPSSLDLSAAEIELSAETGREYVLKDLLNPFRKIYDFILIDCPPSLGLLTFNAFTAADEIYIPVQAQCLALNGLGKLIEVIDKVKKRLNKKLVIGGVIITQYDARKNLDKDVASAITKHMKDKVFKTKIRNTVALAEAPSQGKDIFNYDQTSNGAKDYMDLCKEIKARAKK